MRIVTMTRDLRPYRDGEPAVVSEALAEILIKDGSAKDSRPYPPPDVAPEVPVRSKTLTLPRHGYLTRKRG